MNSVERILLPFVIAAISIGCQKRLTPIECGPDATVEQFPFCPGRDASAPGEDADEETDSEGDSDELTFVEARMAAGFYHTCVTLPTADIRCWGYNGFGCLGYGNTETIGDDEVPSDVGRSTSEAR